VDGGIDFTLLPVIGGLVSLACRDETLIRQLALLVHDCALPSAYWSA